MKYLIQCGYNVLVSDSDILYLKNPLQYLEENHKSDYDLAFLDDGGIMNAGFMYLRNTSNTIFLLWSALKEMKLHPKIDDQIALQRAYRYHDDIFTVVQLPRESFVNGMDFWGNNKIQLYSHEFHPDFGSCADCIVIHNNYIIFYEAKRYRSRECGFWIHDPDGYYSDVSRRYLTYDNPVIAGQTSEIKSTELQALKQGLRLAAILNRTLILPAFNCPTDEGIKPCTLLHQIFLRHFEKEFPDYREHVFLEHPLVPREVKRSQSPRYCFSDELHVRHNLPCQKHVPVNKISKIYQSSMLDTFHGSEYKVLRFSFLYDTNFVFDNSVDADVFNKRLEKGIRVGNYMQKEI